MGARIGAFAPLDLVKPKFVDDQKFRLRIAPQPRGKSISQGTQYAYYAAFGNDGLDLLTEVIAYARSLGLLTILDAKRADIGETMEQYGHEVFGRYNADACTFVPYLGDTIMPSKCVQVLDALVCQRPWCDLDDPHF